MNQTCGKTNVDFSLPQTTAKTTGQSRRDRHVEPEFGVVQGGAKPAIVLIAFQLQAIMTHEVWLSPESPGNMQYQGVCAY